MIFELDLDRLLLDQDNKPIKKEKKQFDILTINKRKIRPMTTNISNNVATDIQKQASTTVVNAADQSYQPVPVFMNVHEFLMTYKDKIQNVDIIDVPILPTGKYLMFKSKVENDIIFMEELEFLWVENINPVSIRVEKSGIIILHPMKRMYVSKTNTIIFSINGDKIISTQSLSKARKIDKLKVVTDTNNSTARDIESVKIHIRAVEQKLFNSVKGITSDQIMRSTIMEFMDKTKDINHLVKIEKQVMMACNI
jgi:hypothetical protein